MHNTRYRSSSLFRRGYLAVALASAVTAACGWNPSRPFEREAPQVKEAIAALDAGDASHATLTLQEYLSTGACKEGNIGTPDLLKLKPDGTFDLGLALFKIAESHGRRFGEEELDSGADPTTKGLRSENLSCALRIVRAIAEDPKQTPALRARARYLEGNLLFLDAAYEDAVKAYDRALEIIPGVPEAGADAGRDEVVDTIGQDAAWNRAIALRRIEDKKDAGQDASSDSGDPEASAGDSGGGDSGGDSGGEGGKNDGDSGGGGGDDGGADAKGDDAGDDPGKKPDPPPEAPDAGPPPPSRADQDERILDQLENAPTVQQEAAKRHARKAPMRGLVDK